MPTPSTQLLLGDAVPLAQAWTQHLAESAGIRVVFLKGVGLHHHGLRPPRTSSDLDVLVEPQSFDGLIAALEGAGWHERRSSFASRRFTVHSRTFVHAGWPCDIDVHANFPGFLADRATVFDELWRRSVLIDVAHRPCRIPDRSSSIAVLALHSLRGSELLLRHRNELAQLRGILRPSDAERADLGALAETTGCVDTLDTLWAALGITFAAEQRGHPSEELRAWRERVASRSWGSYFWLAALRDAAPADRVRLLRHALWPDAADIRLDHAEVGPRRRDLAWARVLRLGRGVRSTPNALRALLRHRRRGVIPARRAVDG